MKIIFQAVLTAVLLTAGLGAAAAEELKVTVFFTGHLIGNYEPCG